SIDAALNLQFSAEVFNLANEHVLDGTAVDFTVSPTGIIAPTALTLFYGSSYAQGAIPLAILSISTIITAIFTLYTTTFGAIGKTGQVLKINIIAAISTILSLLLLVPLLETAGAASSRLITALITITLATYLLRKEIKLQIDKEALWKSIVSTVAFIPILLIIENMLNTQLSIILMLGIEIIIAAMIYLFFLYFLKALKKEDFDLLRQAMPKQLTKYIDIFENKIVR
ncbi:MAG: polysaccharide biosynthesis C-terminal domain-containing protein, partial [Candidatus Bathyarchaeota archaeon]